MLTEKESNNLILQSLPQCSKEVLKKLYEYYQLIEQENSKYNLTGFYNEKLLKEAIIESILIFLDIEKNICNLTNKSVLDIGSGAGFPILPYFIYKQDFSLTIYEPQSKRVNFLNLVKNELKLKNIDIQKVRAEDSNQIECFDFISARAVSELKNLLEISHHLLKINGIACFLKSNKYQQEIANSNFIVNKLNINLKTRILPIYFNIENVLIFHQKLIKTASRFPRKWSLIIKNNLKNN